MSIDQLWQTSKDYVAPIPLPNWNELFSTSLAAQWAAYELLIGNTPRALRLRAILRQVVGTVLASWILAVTLLRDQLSAFCGNLCCRAAR